MVIPNLESLRGRLTKLATTLFSEITGVSKEIRPDKIRLGMKVMVQFESTRNILFFSVGEPSEAAHVFAAKKAFLCEFMNVTSSGNMEDEGLFRFAGCIVILVDGQRLNVSTSGLFSKEDVAVSLILAADILQCAVAVVIQKVMESGGKLPEELFSPDHYLYALLKKYN